MEDLELRERKRRLREEVRTLLANHPEDERRLKSEAICAHALALPMIEEAASVLAFMPLPYEVQIRPLLERFIAAGKRVAVPCSEPKERRLRLRQLTRLDGSLRPGPHGILEPAQEHCAEVSGADIEVALVPGIAYDAQGGRLGQGLGYFDRFLASLPSDCVRIGLAYGFQICDAVPLGGHDQKVDWLITEKGAREVR